MSELKKIIKFFINLPKVAILGLLDLYQLLLSPDHSWLKGKYPYGYCRHYPSCSEYAKQSITKFGLIKGFWLSLKRVARCNPFTEPKVDQV